MYTISDGNNSLTASIDLPIQSKCYQILDYYCLLSLSTVYDSAYLTVEIEMEKMATKFYAPQYAP